MAEVHQIEGVVQEVLRDFGVVHVVTDRGEIFSVNRRTAGTPFDRYEAGQRVVCEIVDVRPPRVVSAQLLQ